MRRGSNIGWLLSYTLASMAASWVVVKIYDYIFGAANSTVESAARFGVFATTWTAVTAKAGMQGFTKRVRKVKHNLIQRVLH